MISDYDLFVNKYISVPKDMGALNCAAFVAGIVKGVLDGAGFPARCVYSRFSLDAKCREHTGLRPSTEHAPEGWGGCCPWRRVTVHFVPVKGQPKPKTTILMKFDAAVLAREHRLPSV